MDLNKLITKRIKEYALNGDANLLDQYGFLITMIAKEYAAQQLILSGVSTRTFAENQEVTYKGKKYFFKEYNPKNGKTLIANAKSVRYNDYNDWWVDSTYVG